MINGYYVLDGARAPQPADLDAWASFFHDTTRRRVCETELPNEVQGAVRVSTVFFGLDMRQTSAGNEPPLVFETKIFGGPLDQNFRRYPTWDDAVAGHEWMLQEAIAAGREAQDELSATLRDIKTLKQHVQ